MLILILLTLVDGVIVPDIMWGWTTPRVLVMQYMEGMKLSDSGKLDAAGIDRRAVLGRIHNLFQRMIFNYGFLHCDPHPGNLLVRKKDPSSHRDTGGILASLWRWFRASSRAEWELVVLDHGLYRKIPLDLRLRYASLWLAILQGNEGKIEENFVSVLKFSADDRVPVDKYHRLYRLFSCLLTQRAWASIEDGLLNRQKISLFGGISSDVLAWSGQNTVMTATSLEELRVIRDKAPDYVKDTLILLTILPRDFLLLLKTNDLLKYLDRLLLGPAGYFERRSTLIILKTANNFLYEQHSPASSSFLRLLFCFMKA
jgi:aarF domain-containing kinase